MSDDFKDEPDGLREETAGPPDGLRSTPQQSTEVLRFTPVLYVWLALGLTLLVWFAISGNGRVFVPTDAGSVSSAPMSATLAGDAEVSFVRSLGVWIGAAMTLCIFSFLWRDNPAYKVAESILVGVSAAYYMVQAGWTVLLPELIVPLFPAVSHPLSPGVPAVRGDLWWLRIVPLVLGLMLLMRLSPKGGWLARWPLALIIGTTAGLKLVGFLQADFLVQVRSTIEPGLLIGGGSMTALSLARYLIVVVAAIAALTYFFFSAEHRGPVGAISRLGIWVLMITFGAAFAYTVMGRIALLQIRFEFLFRDWLWLIDTDGSRFVGG